MVRKFPGKVPESLTCNQAVSFFFIRGSGYFFPLGAFPTFAEKNKKTKTKQNKTKTPDRMLQKILNLLNFQKVRHSTENSGDTGTNIDRDNSKKKVPFFLFCLFVCLFVFLSGVGGGGGEGGCEVFSYVSG